MTAWIPSKIEVRREYGIADAPDLQDGTRRRRMVIRPDRVTLHQIHGTNLVRYAIVEGRQVRRNDTLGSRRMVVAGRNSTRWSNATPPEWLDKLLAEEELEWSES